jgi:PKD repeat protein
MLTAWFYVLLGIAAPVLLLGTSCAAPVEVKASFTANPTYGTGPLEVSFSDRSTGDIDSWTWDFDGDGVVDSVEQNPTFVYTESGTYSISLVVSGPGGQDNNSKTYYIDLD